jgi:predicted transcriptional regulator
MPEDDMQVATDVRLSLGTETAAELMRPDPPVIRHDATLHQALSFFIDRNVAVAPVVDQDGVSIGVLSATDLLIHVREASMADLATRALPERDPVTAETMMTPTIFAVGADTSAREVVRDMLQSKVHHLFVTDPRGTIKGVISTSDVLAHLK